MPTITHPHMRGNAKRRLAPVPDQGATSSNVGEPPGLSLNQAMQQSLMLSYRLVHHLSDLERAQHLMRRLMLHRLPVPTQRKETAPLVAMFTDIETEMTVAWHDLLAELAVLVTWLREEDEEAAGGPPGA